LLRLHAVFVDFAGSQIHTESVELELLQLGGRAHGRFTTKVATVYH